MKKLKDCKSGEIIKWNDYEWIVIDYDENSKVLLMKDILENRAFDEDEDNPTNNWKKCSLRKYLNEDFYNRLEDKEHILDYESDLIADNGDDDYGTSTDKIFLISMDFYRHHRKEITLPNSWWWTITPYSSNTYSVRSVNADGSSISNSAYNGNVGVRPACLASSSIQVDSDDEPEKKEKWEDLSEDELSIYQRGKADMLQDIIEYCTGLLEEMKEKL